MTNKTITPACCTCGNPTACGKMICEECCYEPFPVPPAGGPLQCWNCEADFTLADRANCDGCCWKCGNEIDLDDYITRLQAEVDRLKDRLADANAIANLATANLEEFKEDHQSELTKARECLKDIRQSCELSELRDAQIDAILSNQSAPAGKDEECVHDFRMFSGECHKCGADWIPGKDYAPAEKGQCESVACTHGIRAPHACDQCEAQNAVPNYWEDPDTGTCIDQWSKIQGLNGTEAYSIPLYRHAEQPAPVAAVMPKRRPIDWMENRGDEFSEGWNACLDEVARLNSEPKP